jgi:serine/threonine-protein kinase
MSPQSSIAHYRISSKLGQGGMGAVYRATDTKLNREVAVKVLPDIFAADPDRFARFTREAQVLASLNHPNIAAIYGVEERALILELVEGPTLAERIALGPIPLDEALPIALQIAEALEYAHEKGIVHRDLKPANVKLTPDGRVKVLDFGLAKALASDPIPGNPASSPTLTMRATMAGIVIGTPAYMSPEQAKGKPVDRRADIWAFGILLAEMLTGCGMYVGETVSEVLAAVIMNVPVIPPSAPPQVRALLRRCLEKDPQFRLQAIGEARISLARPSPDVPDTPPAGAPAGRGVPWWALGAAAVMILVLAFFLWRVTRPVYQPMERLSVDLGPEAVDDYFITAAISPDGTRIVFPVRTAGNLTMLATRLLDQYNPAILPGTANAGQPFFSPDGQWIGFAADQKLKKISVNGGAAVPLCDAPNMRGAAWDTDGTIYAALDLKILSRVSAAGGSPQPIASVGQSSEHAQHSHRWPQILPGGGALLVTAGSNATAGGWDDASIEVFSFKTGQFKIVQRGGYFGRYLSSGHLIYVHQETLFAVPFSLARLETQGMPVPIFDDIAGANTNGGGQLDFSGAPSGHGTLIYLSGKNIGEAPPAVWVDAAGGKKPLWATPPGPLLSPRLSPDGTKMAVSVNRNIWVYDPQRGSTLRLSFDSATDAYPVWTPDGKHIVYNSRAGGGGIWWVRSDGSDQPQLLYEAKNGTAIPGSFTPDGRRLAFHQAAADTGRDIWTLPLDLTDPDHPKPGKPELFVATPADDVEPAFSPDGHWLAYTSSEAGGYQVYVRPFPITAGAGKWQVSAGGGRFPVWSRTSKELFYASRSPARIMVVSYAAGDTFSPGAPRQWSETAIQFTDHFPPMDLAPDGKRFVVFRAPESASGGSTNVHVNFLLNFFDELKRRAP